MKTGIKEIEKDYKLCPYCKGVLDKVTKKIYECDHCETQFNVENLAL